MPVIKSLTKRPAHKVLETRDILWLPHHLRVPDSSGKGSFSNLLWPFGHLAMVFFKEEAKQNEPNNPVPKGLGTVPYVVEAIKNAKNAKDERISQVREWPYDDWFLLFNTLWHGRIQKPSPGGPVALLPAEQMALVTKALRHLDNPYSTWGGPSLDDDGIDARFSCSKLMLVAAYRALGITLDDIPGPRRFLSCAARSLKQSPHIFDVLPPPPPPPPSPPSP